MISRAIAFGGEVDLLRVPWKKMENQSPNLTALHLPDRVSASPEARDKANPLAQSRKQSQRGWKAYLEE